MKVVVDLQDRRGIWAMPSWVPERIGRALPADAELVMIEAPSDGSGDGTARVDPTVLAAVEDADVYMGHGIPAELLRRGRRLRWVHTGSAGVGKSLTPEMLESPVWFTNSAGVHAPPMAETVLAMMLYFARGLDIALGAQARGRWDSPAFWAPDAPLTELSRSTVGVVGFGGIGREVARRAAALGARVLGLKRGESGTGIVTLEGVGGGAGDRAVDRVGDGAWGEAGADGTVGGGAPRGEPGATAAAGAAPHRAGAATVGTARVLHGPAGLAALLEESDYLVVAAPETRETRGLIGRAELARMKPSAVLVNVSRGSLVEEDALVEALSDGRLRGAALDVFAVEPLPEGHALWALPGVLITPHVSAVTRAFWERESELIVDNLRRFAAGEPLRNLVDKRAGY